jgi:outer membrane lipoprotein-sorting protein
MRRLLPLLLAFVLALPAAAAPMQRRVFTEQQKATLDKVSAYLNTIRSFHSGFLQVGPDGQAVQGEFFLSKPGHARFSYNPPSPVLIVATGGKVYVKNSRLNTVDSYDQSDTPLPLLLTESIDLKANRLVLRVQEENGAIIIGARTSTNRNSENIQLEFALPNLELRQWTVKDNQGGVTTVSLQNAQPGAAMPEGIFMVPTRNLALKK